MSNSIISGLPITSGTPATLPTRPAGESSETDDFTTTLKSAIHQVDQLSQDSRVQTTELLQGDRQDIHNVMIAVEKADVAFQLMMQVRNKIVNAYQDIAKLQF